MRSALLLVAAAASLVACRGRSPHEHEVVDAGESTDDRDAGAVDAGFDDVADAGAGSAPDAGFASLDAPPVLYALGLILVGDDQVEVFWETDGETCAIKVETTGFVRTFDDLPGESVNSERIVLGLPRPTPPTLPPSPGAPIRATLTCTRAGQTSTRTETLQRRPAPVVTMTPGALASAGPTTVRVCLIAEGDCRLALDHDDRPAPRTLPGFFQDENGSAYEATDLLQVADDAEDADVPNGAPVPRCVDVVADDALFAVAVCRGEPGADFYASRRAALLTDHLAIGSASVALAGEISSLEATPGFAAAAGSDISLSLSAPGAVSCTLQNADGSSGAALAPLGSTTVTLLPGSHTVQCLDGAGGVHRQELTLRDRPFVEVVLEPLVPFTALDRDRRDVARVHAEGVTGCLATVNDATGERQEALADGDAVVLRRAAFGREPVTTRVDVHCATPAGDAATATASLPAPRALLSNDGTQACLVDDDGCRGFVFVDGAYETFEGDCGPASAFWLCRGDAFASALNEDRDLSISELTLPLRRQEANVSWRRGEDVICTLREGPAQGEEGEGEGETEGEGEDESPLCESVGNGGCLVQPEGTTSYALACDDDTTQPFTISVGPVVTPVVTTDADGATRVVVTAQYVASCELRTERTDGSTALEPFDPQGAIVRSAADMAEVVSLSISCFDPFGTRTTAVLDADAAVTTELVEIAKDGTNTQLCWTSTADFCDVNGGAGVLRFPGEGCFNVIRGDSLLKLRCGLTEEVLTVPFAAPSPGEPAPLVRYFNVFPRHVQAGEPVTVYFDLAPELSCSVEGVPVAGSGSVVVSPVGPNVDLVCTPEAQNAAQVRDVVGPTVLFLRDDFPPFAFTVLWQGEFLKACRVEREDGSVVVRGGPSGAVSLPTAEPGNLQVVCEALDGSTVSDR